MEDDIKEIIAAKAAKGIMISNVLANCKSCDEGDKDACLQSIRKLFKEIHNIVT